MKVIARKNIWHNGAVLTAGGSFEVSPDDAAQFVQSGLADIPQAPETENIKSQEKNSPAENIPEKPVKAAPAKQAKAVKKAKKMSIYDSTIPADLDDIFSDDDGFWEYHNVNGCEIKAIVHAASLSTRSALIDLGTYGADKICIVRRSDYSGELPEIDSVFFLDEIEYRVSVSSVLGGLCYRVALRKISG